ncbi:60Kd inner membrane protein-domain-containing protein [Pholiota molesta]|nr:60Kd inner membrane protein-domain-containing protein [Pholiota molesta]
MFALHRARLRTRPQPAVRNPPGRRFFVQTVCNGFLDLALALPLPPSLPPYSTTIIITTIVSRFALLPLTIWGNRRMRRAQEVVDPEIRTLRPLLAKRIFNDMQAARIRGNKEYLQKYHAEKLFKEVTAHRKALLKKYRCSPLPSMIIPPLSQLPVFMGFTILLNRLSTDPTPFDSESFLTLTSLAHSDPTMALPLALGFLTMLNVESRNWFMNAAERERQQALEGQPHISNLIKPVLRGLSIVRIVVAALTPGSVTLYWVTSAAFGLVQTWMMDWIDMKRRHRPTNSNRDVVSERLQPMKSTTKK